MPKVQHVRHHDRLFISVFMGLRAFAQTYDARLNL